VQIKGSLSDKLTIESGVPQGSIFGSPVVYIIYSINNLADNLSDASIHLSQVKSHLFI